MVELIASYQSFYYVSDEEFILKCTSLLVIVLPVSIWKFFLESNAEVSRVSGTAPGHPIGQARVLHNALLPVVVALSVTINR